MRLKQVKRGKDSEYKNVNAAILINKVMLTKIALTRDTSKMVGTTLNTKALSTKFIPLKRDTTSRDSLS